MARSKAVAMPLRDKPEPRKRATTKPVDDADVDERPAKRAKTSSQASDEPTKAAKGTKAVKDTKPTKTTKSQAKAPVKAAAKATTTKASSKPQVINVAPTQRLEVYVCGTGDSGELGLGVGKGAGIAKRLRKNDKLEPKAVGVVSLSCGGIHNAALTAEGQAWTWGANDDNTLGRDTVWAGAERDIGDESDSDDDDDSGSDLNPLEATPAAVPSDLFPVGTKITEVAAGDTATFVVTGKGDVYGWGHFRDSQGKYGFTVDSKTNKVIEVQHSPLHLDLLKNIKSISAGSDYVLAVDTAGKVYSWGNDQQGQLGRGSVKTRHVPREHGLIPANIHFPRGTEITYVHAGGSHAFAIDKKGHTWAWGLNNFGQTGIMQGAGTGGNTITTPHKVTSLGTRMKMVQGGTHFSVGVTHDGECLVWGRVDGGQMGMDVTKLPDDLVAYERNKPRILLEPTPTSVKDCIWAAAGTEHVIAISSNGKLYSWGFNASSQCGQRVADDDLVKEPTEMKIPEGAGTPVWAGAGGQYSIVMCAPKAATNGTH
ncbi:RCC1/BLIP-II [Microthyrium microscopicum]|uniref:RCC1/BLIP-II n=1 Tax=Microthyrium microscopicum TaxID=703497 RepID=A0A6A6USZ2_9PEZI|nr:RCC1/BLIP-II [Microthyrium microscopicum]